MSWKSRKLRPLEMGGEGGLLMRDTEIIEKSDMTFGEQRPIIHCYNITFGDPN